MVAEEHGEIRRTLIDDLIEFESLTVEEFEWTMMDVKDDTFGRRVCGWGCVLAWSDDTSDSWWKMC